MQSLESRRLLAAEVTSSFSDRVADHFATSEGRNGLAVLNLTTGQTSAVNGDQVFGTSSTIKLGVLYALLRKIDADPNLTLDSKLNVQTEYGTTAGRGNLVANTEYTLRHLSEVMIEFSDNWATNRLMDFISVAKINQEFADLGLTHTRIDRYNTGPGSISMHGLAGVTADYKAGHDNESTPNELVSLLRQIHENTNQALLTTASRDAFWEIAQRNNDDAGTGNPESWAQQLYPESVFVNTGSNSWDDAVEFYKKTGSNTWTGAVGDFADDPGIGNHFQRSEAGRIDLQLNNQFLFYAVFVDESDVADAAELAIQCVGYELAAEFADAPVTHTPAGCELDDGSVLTVRSAAADAIEWELFSGDPDRIDIQINGSLIHPFDASTKAADRARVLLGDGDDRFGFTGDLAVPGLTHLLVDAGAGLDQVYVKPSTITAIEVQGGDPQTGDADVPPGDVLAVDLSGVANAQVPQGAVNGTITAPGWQSIQYSSIETLVTTEIVVEGSDQDDAFLVQLSAANPELVEVYRNGQLYAVAARSGLSDGIRIRGNDGNDTLIVDSTNGLIDLQEVGIRFDGGGGFDRVELRQTDGPIRESSLIHVGPTSSSGQSLIIDGAETQLVSFENIEPFIDVVPAAIFTIGGVPALASLLQDDNQIQYSAGQILGPTAGRVTIDNYEPIEFENKVLLRIEAGAGSDQISLNNPLTPTALAAIFVAGGEPTAGSDSVVLNGTAGADTIGFTAIGTDAAIVTGAGPVPIQLDEVEQATLNGQGGGDALTIFGSEVSDVIVHTPHAGPDEGAVRVGTLLGLSYQNLSVADGASLTIDGTAGDDELVVFGTAWSDTFDVAATTGAVTLSGPGGDRLPIQRAGVAVLTLEGLAGDDRFAVAAPQPYTAINVHGGEPGNSDSLAIDGAAGIDEAFTVDPAPVPGDGSVDVNALATLYTGIEHLFLSGNAGDADDVTVFDDLRDNVWNVVPGPVGDLIDIQGREAIDVTSFDTISLTNTFGADVFNVFPTHLVSYATSLTINGGGGVDDLLRLYGTEANDLVTSSADTVLVNGKSVTAGTGLAEVQVLTLGGSDTVDLDLELVDVRKRVEAGTGNDTVDMRGTIDADIDGGDGDDFLIGSADSDFIDGGSGNDTLLGLGSIDTLYGGEGNDIIIGGAGNDLMFGQADSDILVWNPGDGSDLMEGGEGSDQLQFVGGGGGDDFTLSANGARLRLDRQPGNVVLDVGGVEEVDIDRSVTLVGRLDQAQEVPAPVATAAEGTVTMVYDSDTNTFSIDIFIKGITQADLLNSHIHVAPPGVPGPVIFGLGAGAAWTPQAGGLRRTISGATFPEANIADLLAGNTYVNVHTPLNPAGEIRSQLNLSDDTVPPPTRPLPALAGGDDFIINDLSTTDVRMVNLGLGANNGGADDGAADTVAVFGRSVADDIGISTVPSQTGFADFVDVVGLPYDVRISNAVADDGDRLTVLGTEGDDRIKAEEGVEGTVLITLDGGAGDDVLSADAILIGGPGDDFLEGGAGDDELFGDAGEDVMVGGGGADTFDGGAHFDTILISGTAADDVIDVRQESATELLHTVNGDLQTDTLVAGTVEQARVEAGDGADVIRVAIDDDLFDDAGLSLRMTVHGGDGPSGDRLAIVDDGVDDLTLYRVAQDAAAGTAQVGPENDEPFEHVFDGVETVQFVDEAGNRINAADGAGPRLVVFKFDPYTGNDDRFTATHLGAAQAVNLDPTIDPGPDANFALPADEDWYRIEAAATGLLDFQVFFEEIAELASGRPGLPGSGNLDIEVYDADGTLVAGGGPSFGTNDGPGELDVDGDAFAEDERIRIPAVQGQIYFLRVTGVADAVNSYGVTVLNQPAPTPFDMELDDFGVNPAPNPPGQAENSDTGRSQFDNITYDNTPTLLLRLDDGFFLHDLPGNAADDTPPDEVIAIPFRGGPAQPTAAGYAIAIFDEGATDQAAGAVQTPLGFATATAQEGVYRFTVPAALALSEGSHFLTARVQMIDPADPTRTAFGPRSASLEIIVDRTAPNAALGQSGNPDDGLLPDSDTGVSPPNPHTIADRITRDTTPTLWGRAEADAIIRLYADRNGNGVLEIGTDVFLGQDTAIPLDGTNQEPDGYWEIRSVVDLNDPALFPLPDGLRTLFVTAEDVAGNVNAPVGAADTLRIFVDTAGPVVESVVITNAPAYDLFDPKPQTDGPTPRIDSLTITITDPPDRLAPDFLFDALKADVAAQPGHYRLVGDHSGLIAIQSVTIVQVAPADDEPAEATIRLDFVQPLPDDRFTLIISDAISDPIGNALDGESNAAEPQETPDLPSGDGIPGGDFLARFTVDSRPELGTISQGLVYVDINGNAVFDPEGQDNDATNRDFVYQFGLISDGHFAGNFADRLTGIASGFDKLGVYGLFNGQYSFLVDTDDDGVGDLAAVMPFAYQVNGIPVAGDFAPAVDGDEFGVFDGQAWYLDVNGNRQIDVGERIAANYNGLPIVGDFNGDGNDDLAVFNNDTNTLTFDTDRNGIADWTWAVRDDVARFLGLSGFTDRPVAGDLNLDGIDDIGLWIKGRQGILPKDAGEVFFWVSDRAAANPADVFDAYSPAPLGNDLFTQFGDETSLPIFGNFDPPVGSLLPGREPVRLTNPDDASDVNHDGQVTPLDALRIINALNRGFTSAAPSQAARVMAMTGGNFLDTTADGQITPLDALRVINTLSRRGAAAGEGESAANYAAAVDLALADDEPGDAWSDPLQLMAPSESPLKRRG